MRKHGYVSIVLGILLILLSGYLYLVFKTAMAIHLFIGLALIYLGWENNRKAMIIFGHCLIVVGAYLITWGMYLLPSFKPTFLSIVLGPLFWGIISVMGGICANYHGFCKCIRNNL